MAKGEAEKTSDAGGEGTDKLLDRCGSDAAAFAVLCDIYYPKIFSYCAARVQIRQIAEDFTNAAFMTAAENASKFNGSKRIEFVNWIYKIATEKINAYLKKKSNLENLISAQTQDEQSQTINRPMQHRDILKLSLKEQTVIAFRFFENLPIERIADITGSTPNAVRLEIAGAIENLRVFKTEKQFADYVKELVIDNSVDESRREILRTKIIFSFNTAKLKIFRSLSYFLAGLVILMLAGLVLWISSGKKSPILIITTTEPVKQTEVNIAPQKAEATRLEKIKQLAAENDVAGLAEIVKSGDLAARLLAAKYLAQITETTVAEILKESGIEEKSRQQTSLLIEAIDKKTKQPIAGAGLDVKFDNENEKKFLTDSNGRFQLELPQPLNQMQIHAEAKGYAPMKAEPSGLTAPQSILFEMTKGTTIGGIVVDEKLKGIENAQVKIHIESPLNAGPAVFDTDEILKTDVNGFWQRENFPQDTGQVSIMATHPDYISPDSYQPTVFEQLTDLSFITILEKGISAAGMVSDWEHKPLAAVVSRGANFESQNSVVCDANGKFKFTNIQPGKEIFTAQCSGAAPQILEIDIEPNMTPIIFNLQPPKTIRARVVDDKGTPVKDVKVTVSGWQGYETLNFETTTNENGSFQWTDAPEDEVLFDLYKPGFKPVSNFGMISENDYVISLETQ